MYIEIRREATGRVSAIEVRGHASYDEEGSDVVCAAVSALMHALVLGLRKILRLRIRFLKRRGFMRVRIPEKLADEQVRPADTLTETVVQSLFEIQHKYSEYILVEEVFPGAGKNNNHALSQT